MTGPSSPDLSTADAAARYLSFQVDTDSAAASLVTLQTPQAPAGMAPAPATAPQTAVNWQQRAAELQLACEAARQAFAQSESQRSVLRAQFESLQRRAQADAAEHERRLNASRVEREQLEALVPELQGRVRELEAECERRQQVEHELVTTHQAHQRLTEEAADLRQELESLRQSLAESRSRCDRLAAERDAALQRWETGHRTAADPDTRVDGPNLRRVFTRLRERGASHPC